MAMLKVDGIHVYYGSIHAVKGVSFEVGEGEIVTLIGANGAGKSTLFRILTGELEADEGEVVIAKNRRLGLISQIPVYPEGYTVDDLMASGEAMEFITARKYEGYNVQAEEAIPGWPDQEDLRVNMSLPKFDVSSDLELSDALKALGVTDVFDRDASDFTPLGVEIDGPVYLSQAQHAARVTIDEEGCTAASYVDLMLVGDALPPDEVVDFTLDRPFLFVIRSENIPLFIGVVNQM